VADALGTAGYGDMLKSTYDPSNHGLDTTAGGHENWDCPVSSGSLYATKEALTPKSYAYTIEANQTMGDIFAKVIREHLSEIKPSSYIVYEDPTDTAVHSPIQRVFRYIGFPLGPVGKRKLYFSCFYWEPMRPDPQNEPNGWVGQMIGYDITYTYTLNTPSVTDECKYGFTQMYPRYPSTSPCAVGHYYADQTNTVNSGTVTLYI
jgi:hypothetical protein